MCKTTRCVIIMATTQSIFAFLLIPGYIVCSAASTDLLWQHVFQTSPGLCNQSDKACAIYNIIYTLLNCVVCFASMITSIMLAVNLISDNIQNRTKVILSWLVIDAIFILHLLLVTIFTIVSITQLASGIDFSKTRPGINYWPRRGGGDFEDLGAIINSIALAPFLISMIVAFGFFLPILAYYKLFLKHESYAEDADLTNGIALVPYEAYQQQQFSDQVMSMSPSELYQQEQQRHARPL